jgi:hypothetical protein
MRRLLLPLAAAAALLAPSPASAIVNGTPVAAGAFPAQGSVGIDMNNNGFVDAICSGTLVGSRQFLTAARCVTNSLGNPRSETRLTVRVGSLAAPDDSLTQNVAANDVPDPTEIAPNGYVRSTGENDVAMLTLTQPIYTDLMRVVDRGENALWTPGTSARVLGWGEPDGDISDTLREGTVVRRADTDCGGGFDVGSQLCAASTAPGGTGNPCPGDSGSPLLVPDGGSVVLAGVFSGTACSTAGDPGRFARVGDDLLNTWVHDRTPEANFEFESGLQPRADVPFALVSTSHPAKGAPDFTTFRWDLDDDRDDAFNDASGKRIVVNFHEPGIHVVGIEASTPGGDRTSARFAFDVLPAASPEVATPMTTVAPPAKQPFATILAAKRPKVKRGHFAIRIRFARTAPKGTAVIEVYRGGRRIGIARTKVKRGATKRVRVKLMRSGRRALSRSSTHRLKVRVRVRVGRTILRTKRLTIQRLR